MSKSQCKWISPFIRLPPCLCLFVFIHIYKIYNTCINVKNKMLMPSHKIKATHFPKMATSTIILKYTEYNIYCILSKKSSSEPDLAAALSHTLKRSISVSDKIMLRVFSDTGPFSSRSSRILCAFP